MTYSEKLKDPRWQRKRLRVFERAKWKCEKCGDKKTELHVHHTKYIGNPWDVPLSSLKCLCSNCHGSHHGKTTFVLRSKGPTEAELEATFNSLRAMFAADSDDRGAK
jgi:5-methylcytosine-specific restriction endonuclease McrA